MDRLRARWRECHFWATHAGAELDLLVLRGRTRLGFEIERTVAPSVTPFPLSPRIRAVALSRLLEDLAPLP